MVKAFFSSGRSRPWMTTFSNHLVNLKCYLQFRHLTVSFSAFFWPFPTGHICSGSFLIGSLSQHSFPWWLCPQLHLCPLILHWWPKFGSPIQVLCLPTECLFLDRCFIRREFCLFYLMMHPPLLPFLPFFFLLLIYFQFTPIFALLTELRLRSQWAPPCQVSDVTTPCYNLL